MVKNVSAKGLHFIASFEGWVPSCYNDAANNCTIGYGHLVHPGPTTDADRKRWGTISRSKGLDLLHADAQIAVNAVRRYIHVPLTQAQFDALVSFAYNCGAHALNGTGVAKAVNSKPKKPWPLNVFALKRWHARVRAALLQWDHAGGKVVPGLYRRRLDEARLFSSGKYIV